jgi:hypothetical protein
MGLGSRSQKGTGSRIRNTALKQKTRETIPHKLVDWTVQVRGEFFSVRFWLGTIFPPSLANINVGRTYYS